MSYAASFGTENLEYEYETIQRCTELLECFNAVSVRESSAVTMCEEWLDCDRAVHVLDPVMLLDADTYRALASSASEHPCEGKVATYILDRTPEKQAVVDFMARVSGCEVADLSVRSDMKLPASKRVVPPIEDWLAGFMDARCVVTDSFHGCVMSILFHKPFVAVGNSRRGMARLESLLAMFGLDMRLVQGIDPEDDGEFFLSDPDWAAVDAVLENERMKSVSFLREGLRKS
jgi:exopolysaccharide biosynthesis predicted pyruvyltransferase EpsI